MFCLAVYNVEVQGWVDIGCYYKSHHKAEGAARKYGSMFNKKVVVIRPGQYPCWHCHKSHKYEHISDECYPMMGMKRGET